MKDFSITVRKDNMNFKDYTWDKEFEIKGYFSERSDAIVSENNLSGILHYSPREIVLELFGEFEEETGISFGFGKHLEKIYGFSSSGNILILNTYGEPMVHSSSPGFPITRYRVKNFKIYSVFYNELENFDYSSEVFKNLRELYTSLHHQQHIVFMRISKKTISVLEVAFSILIVVPF